MLQSTAILNTKLFWIHELNEILSAERKVPRELIPVREISHGPTNEN